MKRAEMTQEQKTARNKQNAASRRAYEAKAYDKLLLRVRKDGADGVTADQIRHAAEQCGQSVNAWILEAIRDRI